MSINPVDAMQVVYRYYANCPGLLKKFSGHKCSYEGDLGSVDFLIQEISRGSVQLLSEYDMLAVCIAFTEKSQVAPSASCSKSPYSARGRICAIQQECLPVPVTEQSASLLTFDAPPVTIDSDEPAVVLQSDEALQLWKREMGGKVDKEVWNAIKKTTEIFTRLEGVSVLPLQVDRHTSIPDLFKLPRIYDRVEVLNISDNSELKSLPDSVLTLPKLEVIDARRSPNLKIVLTHSQRKRLIILVDCESQIVVVKPPKADLPFVFFPQSGLPHANIDIIKLDQVLSIWSGKEIDIIAPDLLDSIQRNVVSFIKSQVEKLVFAVGEHKSLPDVFELLSISNRLKHLDVSGNSELESLPNSLFCLSALQSIDISRCPKLKLSAEMLSRLPPTFFIYADRDIECF
ncbi:MAG: hypothetical protein P4L16_05550 [Chlamydiales bacterium]|nr:hypothetical protein [Chlamydiales bacterium]